MTENAREYNYSDVKMLTGSLKVAESFKFHLPELSPKRTDWTSIYADALITKINLGFEKLGVDPKKDLRSASEVVSSIMKPSKEGLAFFKTEIMDDFRKDTPRRVEILLTLGFTEHLRGVQLGQQESLIELLFKFKTNMTPALRTEITAKGLKDESIDEIIGYANTLVAADVTQETFKETTKEVTQEVIDSFNNIYLEIIGICLKAAKIFRNSPLKRDKFIFSKVIRNLGTPPAPTTALKAAKKPKV